MFIAVTTAPRSTPTLKRTVASLESSGLTVNKICEDTKGNAWQNWLTALAAGLESGDDLIAIVQDDLVCCRGLADYLDKTAPRDAIASPYCPSVYRAEARGWQRQDNGWATCGALFYVLPQAVAAKLYRDLRSHTATNPPHIDGLVGKWAQEHGVAIYYHTPSLVQHTGRVSTLGYGAEKCRQASDFIGEDTTYRLPRVTFVSPAFHFGGAERHLLDTMSHISAETTLLILDRPEWQRPQAVELARKYARVVVAEQDEFPQHLADQDVVIVWGFPNLGKIVQGYSGRVVQVVHGSDLGGTSDFVRGAVGTADHYVAVSKAALRPLKHHNIPPEQTTIIYNGVEAGGRLQATEKRPTARFMLGLEPSDFVIGYTGRLANEKKLTELIEALKLLPNKYKAVLCGEGFQKAQLIEQAKPLGDRVKFYPHGYRIGNLLAAFDCYFGNSQDEGFWYGGAEAALLKVPLVTTTVGILQEIQEEHGTLWHEMPKGASPQQIATAIKALSQDPNRRKRADKLAKIMSAYSVERSGIGWQQLIDRLIAQPANKKAIAGQPIVGALGYGYEEEPYDPVCNPGDGEEVGNEVIVTSSQAKHYEAYPGSLTYLADGIEYGTGWTFT